MSFLLTRGGGGVFQHAMGRRGVYPNMKWGKGVSAQGLGVSVQGDVCPRAMSPQGGVSALSGGVCLLRGLSVQCVSTTHPRGQTPSP